MSEIYTMTFDEVRRYIAERHGWQFNDSAWFPATLDGAARAMPEGWTWLRHNRSIEISPDVWTNAVVWQAWTAPHYGLFEGVITRDTGDEIADRYRLAALCWESIPTPTPEGA